MSSVASITGHSFSDEDMLFIDANVLLYIYGPVGPSHRLSTVYSNSLKGMVEKQSRLFVDVQVMSEFINRFAQMEWKQLPEDERPVKFKQFRHSKAFTPVAKEISQAAKDILSISQKCGSCFETADTDAIFDEFTLGRIDFNDQIYVEICKTNGFTLVTHDKDFRSQGIDILTANNNLIS